MDFYHVLNRGVEGRTIFPQQGDYVRFVHGLYTFNDTRAAQNTTRTLGLGGMNDIVSRSLERRREPLVHIHGWCVMKNHYHLLLSERKDGGISKFIRKLNIGYAKYFNEKYHHSGYVFQGRTKKILIKREAHYQHILNYIHLNPLDYLGGAREWRKRKLTHVALAEAHLASYRWSSYLDYAGKKNFPSIVTTRYFDDPPGSYAKELKYYMRSISVEPIAGLLLE